MTGNDAVSLIIVLAMSIFLIILSVILLSGRGAFLIAGYNTSSKEEKERWDDKALCKFVGKILLPISIFLPSTAMGSICQMKWLSPAYAAGVLALCGFAVVYINTGNRFKR